MTSSKPLLRSSAEISSKQNTKKQVAKRNDFAMQQQNPLASPNKTAPPPRFKCTPLIKRGVRSSTSLLKTSPHVHVFGVWGQGGGSYWKKLTIKWLGKDSASDTSLTPSQLPNLTHKLSICLRLSLKLNLASKTWPNFGDRFISCSSKKWIFHVILPKRTQWKGELSIWFAWALMGLLILALRCLLAQFLSWRTEPTSAKLRKYLLMYKYLTSRHRCTLAKFCFLDGICAANDCALLVTLL